MGKLRSGTWLTFLAGFFAFFGMFKPGNPAKMVEEVREEYGHVPKHGEQMQDISGLRPKAIWKGEEFAKKAIWCHGMEPVVLSLGIKCGIPPSCRHHVITIPRYPLDILWTLDLNVILYHIKFICMWYQLYPTKYPICWGFPETGVSPNHPRQ